MLLDWRKLLKIDRIVFWQPIDSPHQHAFLEAVAEQFSGEVILGVERPFPADRVAQGWKQPEHDRVKVVNIGESALHATLSAHGGPDSLHVFSGFFSHSFVWSGFHKLAASRAHLAVYSEAPEQSPLTGWLKRLRGRWLAARWTARIAFILAVGGIGCEFFRKIGVPNDKIFPFGYYLAVQPAPLINTVPHDGVFRFISAGQLVRRKGIDLAIRACAMLPARAWRLDIYGNGPERGSLERLAARLGLSDRITFHGSVPNPLVQSALAAADCALLPSRFDGWGALVNEAIAGGTPVVCTDKCGAAALVAEDDAGSLVCTSNTASLGTAMRLVVHRGKPAPMLRQATHAVASRHSAAAAASRLLRRLIPAAGIQT